MNKAPATPSKSNQTPVEPENVNIQQENHAPATSLRVQSLFSKLCMYHFKKSKNFTNLSWDKMFKGTEKQRALENIPEMVRICAQTPSV